MFQKFIHQLSWPILLVAALALGLAPFTPEPHLVEKLRMLGAGTLNKPVDIFDLCFHASPLLLIILKMYIRKA